MKGFECTELYAFVCRDEDGNEGIVSAEFEGDTIPLVCADLERVKVFTPVAEHIAHANRINITCYHYKRMGEISRDFLDQFVGVRLTGDPEGAGEVPVSRDDPTDQRERGGSGNGGTPVD